ncbi:hypothetical protein FVE85_2588 [Porphyridium purpureum]|uniref:protein-tyrosine-phosphatase n=1 Tax=Porphyridium purpureum TaxID=35688 RepID=A0A5J4YLQ1_PORPP|nr:hypothetical protein FVE85_2588 [Porphyridium purpureum]|eukprot:POR4207..scf291_13
MCRIPRSFALACRVRRTTPSQTHSADIELAYNPVSLRGLCFRPKHPAAAAWLRDELTDRPVSHKPVQPANKLRSSLYGKETSTLEKLKEPFEPENEMDTRTGFLYHVVSAPVARRERRTRGGPLAVRAALPSRRSTWRSSSCRQAGKEAPDEPAQPPRDDGQGDTESVADAGAGSLTVSEALQEWRGADAASVEQRQKGEQREKARGAKESRERKILFVDEFNLRISVVAEAMFTDLCVRRGIEARFFSYSAGTKATVGAAPDADFINALWFRRKLDISNHLAVEFEPQDLDSYDLVVVPSEAVKSQILYMLAPDGMHDTACESKIRVLSSYASGPLRNKQWPDRQYSRESLKFLMSSLVDVLTQLLFTLLEEDGDASTAI